MPMLSGVAGKVLKQSTGKTNWEIPRLERPLQVNLLAKEANKGQFNRSQVTPRW
jgi:hypothetical protein